jgi:hypothetical protein
MDVLPVHMKNGHADTPRDHFSVILADHISV